MSETHVYETYEKEFKAIVDGIERKIAILKVSDKKLTRNEAQRELEEADEIVQVPN